MVSASSGIINFLTSWLYAARMRTGIGGDTAEGRGWKTSSCLITYVAN